MHPGEIKELEVNFHGHSVGCLALDPSGRLVTFRYSPGWISEGFSVSPLELPLSNEIFIANAVPFAGNFGIFEDSMPDGYGRYLLHKELTRLNINDSKLSALDRLSLVGENGMGALCYSPSTSLAGKNVEMVMDFDLLQRMALDIFREKKASDAGLLLYNSGNSGGARPKAVFSDEDGHWLIKFRHIYDPEDIGTQEYECNVKARKCGINVADFRLIENRYFASRRFDIDALGVRVHVATAGALMGLSLQTPMLDYSNLLALTGYLTQRESEVEEMYRRMVFNYLIGNKDDHCKNFSFMVKRSSEGTWRWHLAPAYDLTVNSEGYNGQHATTVNSSVSPELDDFIAVGLRIKMSRARCLELYSQVADNL